jgi:hypothetical protein
MKKYPCSNFSDEALARRLIERRDRELQSAQRIDANPDVGTSDHESAKSLEVVPKRGATLCTSREQQADRCVLLRKHQIGHETTPPNVLRCACPQHGGRLSDETVPRPCRHVVLELEPLAFREIARQERFKGDLNRCTSSLILGEPLVVPQKYSRAASDGIDVLVPQALLATRKSRAILGKLPNPCPRLPEVL